MKTLNSFNCPTIYGPVNSRRHGLSLGINVGNPVRKSCPWSCLYCQCGIGNRSKNTTGFPSREQIISELKSSLKCNTSIESITFAGNTEPSLHPEFYSICKDVQKLRKEMRASWIINCLSNGFNGNKIPKLVDVLDEIWIKIDCGIQDQFKTLNRPLDSKSSIEKHLRTIEQIPQEKRFIQTLLWNCIKTPKLANNNEINKNALIEIYKRIKPKKVHLTTIARSPAIKDLEPCSEVELLKFSQKINETGTICYYYK